MKMSVMVPKQIEYVEKFTHVCVSSVGRSEIGAIRVFWCSSIPQSLVGIDKTKEELSMKLCVV